MGCADPRLDGFRMGSFPVTYLGVPLYRGRVSNALFFPIRQRLLNSISGWSHRYLTFGGRLALVRSTLMTIPLHFFQVMHVPKSTLRELEQIIARFFWGSTDRFRRRHWVRWDHACRPLEEGGLGIRRF